MNRREILKALVTVPVASALGAWKKEDDDKSQQRPMVRRLQILLDGAFAVVVQHDKANSILAFSPLDKKEPHQFYFNDSFYRQEAGKTFHFELLPKGLKKAARPEIAPGFNDFNATTKKWRAGENFITIKLPCPKRIAFAGHREYVVFKSKSRKPGWMPTNHILEYDVLDSDQVKMECQELGKECSTSVDSLPGLMRFFFEVGPSQGTPSNHAVNFFNDMLEASFPELVPNYSIAEIKDLRNEKQSTTAGLMPAVMNNTTRLAELRNASYTLDCKLGGILVNTSTSPNQ